MYLHLLRFVSHSRSNIFWHSFSPPLSSPVFLSPSLLLDFTHTGWARKCLCVFGFRALHSCRVFVGQNADNVFFSLMVSLIKRHCKSLPRFRFTSGSESFHYFWLVVGATELPYTFKNFLITLMVTAGSVWCVCYIPLPVRRWRYVEHYISFNIKWREVIQTKRHPPIKQEGCCHGLRLHLTLYLPYVFSLI